MGQGTLARADRTAPLVVAALVALDTLPPDLVAGCRLTDEGTPAHTPEGHLLTIGVDDVRAGLLAGVVDPGEVLALVRVYDSAVAAGHPAGRTTRRYRREQAS